MKKYLLLAGLVIFLSLPSFGVAPSCAVGTWGTIALGTSAQGGNCTAGTPATTTGYLQEAINACPGSAGCTIIVPANYTATITDCTTANNFVVTNPSALSGIKIKGFGYSSVIELPTGNTNCASKGLIEVAAPYFSIDNVRFSVSGSTDRSGAAYPIIGVDSSSAGSFCSLSNILVSAGTSLVGAKTAGDFLKFSTNGAGCGINGLTFFGQSKWNSLIKIDHSSASSAGQMEWAHIWSSVDCKDACVYIDGYTDTISLLSPIISQYAPSPDTAGLGPVLLVQNTHGTNSPRVFRCVACSFVTASSYAATAETVRLATGLDFEFHGGLISNAATFGMSIGSAMLETKINGIAFSSVVGGGITIASGSAYTNINGIELRNACSGANNTYNGVDVAAGASNFNITGNTITSASNKCKYAVNVATGASNQYVISLNNFPTGNVGTGKINDGGSGVTKVVANNP